MQYKKIKLPYSFDALEPYIDEETMRLHYEKHHAGYEAKLNHVIQGTDESKKYPRLIDLMKKYQKIEDVVVRISVREFGGGVINHNFWFEHLKKDVEPNIESELYKSIVKQWGSFDKFISEFKHVSRNVFGSGWVWVVKRKSDEGDLRIIKVFNQDNPWFLGFKPLMCIDLWEHAYYLKYKNLREDYIENYLKCVNWTFAEEQYLDE